MSELMNKLYCSAPVKFKQLCYTYVGILSQKFYFLYHIFYSTVVHVGQLMLILRTCLDRYTNVLLNLCLPSSPTDTTRAIGLLEDYCSRLRKPEEQQLKTAILRVMDIFKSSLFQALLGKGIVCSLFACVNSVKSPSLVDYDMLHDF